MKKTAVDRIRKINANPAVTIYLNTSRTFPENEKDRIVLKNLILEVEKRLKADFSTNVSKVILKRLQDFCNDYNHNYNLDSLLLFIAEDFFEFYRLPVRVNDKVIIGKKFATKTLLRAVLQEEEYYILCISRKLIRLLNVRDSDNITEITDGQFPYENDYFIKSDDIRIAWSNTIDNITKEFFRKAKNIFNVYYNNNPLPVILAGDVKNLSYYREIAGKRFSYIGQIEGNYDEMKPGNFLNLTSGIIEEFRKDKAGKSIGEIKNAENERRLYSDINDIYYASTEGNVKKLFVEKNFYQPAKISNGRICYLNLPEGSDTIEDIISEIIDNVIYKNGEVVFMPVDSLKNYNRIAVIGRH